MAVPPFHEFFLPFLKVLNERGRTSLKEMRESIAQRMGVSEMDQAELLPSGRQRRYDNRVGWARTYLSRAGLVRTVQPGVFELTDAGKRFLATGPKHVDQKTLRNFESYRQWEEESRAGTSDTGISTPVATLTESDTPEETLSAAFKTLNETLSSEVREALLQVSWQKFEDIVIDVLLALGYGGNFERAGHAFKKSGDSGVDGVINEDRLGLSKIYVQAKRYALENRVGRPEVQGFVGSLLGRQASQGVFITTSSFSKEAHEYVRGLSSQRVILVDGDHLAMLMIENGVGVAERDRYIVRRLDRDYFFEE